VAGFTGGTLRIFDLRGVPSSAFSNDESAERKRHAEKRVVPRRVKKPFRVVSRNTSSTPRQADLLSGHHSDEF
jgi:hypothetical protein